jgi:hypothetical protein
VERVLQVGRRHLFLEESTDMKAWFPAAVAALFSFACGGSKTPAEHPEGPMEEAGESVDEAAEESKEETEEAVDEAGDAVEEAGDEVEDQTESDPVD